MSHFGQFSELRDIDKDHNRYVEKEESDIFIFSCVCQEFKNKGELAPRSPMRIPEAVLNYCDVGKDCGLSKTELNGFLNYMQNMKCIDRKTLIMLQNWSVVYH